MYTGQFYAHLLALCACKDSNDVHKLPYKFRYARKICDKPENIGWFLQQLNSEDIINKEIKKNTGEYDPLYTLQLKQLEPYYKNLHLKSNKELLMYLYSQFK